MGAARLDSGGHTCSISSSETGRSAQLTSTSCFGFTGPLALKAGKLRLHSEAEGDWSPGLLLPSSLFSNGRVLQPLPSDSPQLPFAVLPILTFTSMPALMQEFANGL